MTIQVENESGLTLSFDYEKMANRVIGGALEVKKCPYEVEINLVLTTDEEIQEINKEYREIDKPTDVLSFPMVDYEEPCDFSDVEDQPEDFFNPDTGALILGDIIISIPRIIEQAQEYGHSVEREYAFLLVHSVLHLLGYDHIAEEDRVVMEKEQKEILDYLEIYR